MRTRRVGAVPQLNPAPFLLTSSVNAKNIILTTLLVPPAVQLEKRCGVDAGGVRCHTHID
ncbi:hypothetical protein HY442_00270 [Candidatus Parcubacteria bacterium]|nr:hypothetical protein [Candidatus Parcubacteria bacterium]MBI4098947.1 hypothetical protein [Candidatus Parcubacteria bacterium]